MKRKTDIIVQFLDSDIKNKCILEVACGCADFSISASRTAKKVFSIDIDNSRLPELLPENVCFEKMDASCMSYPDESFDTIIIYNAFSHIYSQWDMIKNECFRVIRPMGKVYIISTWKLDTSLMKEVFEKAETHYKDFVIVKLTK